MKKTLDSLALHKPLIVFSLSYVFLVSVTAIRLGATWPEFSDVLSRLLGAGLYCLLFPQLVLLHYLIRAIRTTSFDKRWLDGVGQNFEKNLGNYIRNGRLHDGVIALILVVLPIAQFFCIGKSMIPALASYRLDPLFASIDKWLHFGRYPHEYLVRFFEGSDWAHFIDNFYLGWFFAVYLAIGFCTWADPDRQRRLRFLWTYCLAWALIGILAAVAMASVGPIYYADFYAGTSPYAGITDYLRSYDNPDAPMHVLAIREGLLDMVRDDKIINLNAISAMPSLHVALAGAITLYMFEISALAGAACLSLPILTLIGSVWLGWHYAIDGYVGLAMIWLIWALSGWLVPRVHGKITTAPETTPA